MFLFLLIISGRLDSRVETSRVPAQRPSTKLCKNFNGNCWIKSALRYSTNLFKVQVQYHDTRDGVIGTTRPLDLACRSLSRGASR